jgi:hypothetical protein
MWKLFASFIPGGQIVAIADTVLSAIVAAFKAACAFFKALCKSAVELARNPGAWLAVAVVAAFSVAGGIGWERKRSEHLVKRADGQRLTAIKLLQERTEELDAAQKDLEKWKGRLNEQERMAAEAESTHERLAAEARVRLEKAESEARAALARIKRAERVRDGVGAGGAQGAKVGPQDTAGSGLPSLSKLFGGG